MLLEIHVLINATAVVIHGSASIKVDIHVMVKDPLAGRMVIIAISETFVHILTKACGFGKFLKPSGDITRQPRILIRISLNVGDDSLINDKQFTPQLRVPALVKDGMGGVLQVCDDNTRRIHHLYRASSILTMITPLHTGMPALIIITHGDIVQGVNRQAESALGSLDSGSLSMGLTHFFPALKSPCFRQSAKDSGDLSARANLKGLAIGQRHMAFRQFPRVRHQSAGVGQIVVGRIASSSATIITKRRKFLVTPKEFIQLIVKNHFVRSGLGLIFLSEVFYHFFYWSLIFQFSFQNQRTVKNLNQILTLGVIPVAQNILKRGHRTL